MMPRLWLLACLSLSTLTFRPDSAAAYEVLPSPDGDFITQWYVAGPTSRRRGLELLKASEPGGKGWHVLSGPTLYVNAGKARRPRKHAETWFGLVLVCERPLDATLKLGTDGHAEVYVDGGKVSTHERNHNALWDDHLAPLKLTAGRHSLLIRTTRKKKQRGGGWQIVGRIHDATGKTPAGLRLELPSVKRPGLAVAQSATLEAPRQLSRQGFDLTLRLVQSGSTLKGVEVPWEATLDGRPGVLASGVIGGEAIKVPLLLDRDRAYTLTVRAGGRTWSERFDYRAAWHKGLLDARADLAATDWTRFRGEATRSSLLYNTDKLERHVLESIPDRKWLGQQIVRVRGWARIARSGTDPFGAQRGDFYRAYRSRYDDNLQHYSVHIPHKYDRTKRWPLVIGMHGIGSGTHYTLRRVLGRDRDKEGGEPGGKPLIRGNMPKLPNWKVLTASVWGYHNSAYWFYGEDDIMQVIEEMKDAYRIDLDRVYLTGLSLGGLGTYHIGHHYPDVFAALGPLGGFSSIKLYRQIRRHPKTAWEKVLIEQRDATTYAENGLHNPMKVVHGRKDAPRHATAMTDRYEKLGYKHATLDIPELGHDVWQYAYGEHKLVKWMRKFRRPRNPDRIVFKTHTYRYLRAYWARLGWIDDYRRPALLKLHIGRDRRTIVVDEASNLRGLTLDLSRPKLAEGPLTIRFAEDGTEVVVEGRDPVHLRREPGKHWTLAGSADPPAGHKRQGVSGPLDDVMYDPHLFVVGASDPAQADVNRRLVSEDHTYLRHRNHDIWFPRKDDTAVTDDDLRSRNLVLYGNPRSNVVLRKALKTGKLPLRFEDDAIVLAGKRYVGDDVGIKMIFPSPFNPKRMVVIVAGVTWRGTLLSRYLPRMLPDYMVYDSRVSTRYVGRILIDRPVLAAGFFESDWTLPKP